MTANSENRFKSPSETDIPVEVEIAAVNGNLVFFVGNGVSRVYGLPSWTDLASEMIRRLANEKVISYGTADLFKSRSLKEKISIADGYFKKHGPKNSKLTYGSMLKPNSDPLAYQYLAKLKAKFITTNYDTLLYDACLDLNSQRNPVPEVKSAVEKQESPNIEDSNRDSIRIAQTPLDFTVADFLSNNIIWHLHGCIQKEEKIVSATKDYLGLYRNEQIQEMLEHIFTTQVVVFLGYGLDELELLDVIMKASRVKPSDLEKQNIFYILPIYSHEFDIFKDLQSYYKEHLNIQLIPVSQDEFGYKAFEELIKAWSGRLVSNKPDRVQKLNLLQNLIKKVEGSE